MRFVRASIALLVMGAAGAGTLMMGDFYADAALALRDSAAALRLTRQFVDSLMPGLTRMTSNVPYIQEWRWLFAPRMMLMRADLAVAAGQREEARAWYAKVLDRWLEADPELQPTVARIRAALR